MPTLEKVGRKSWIRLWILRKAINLAQLEIEGIVMFRLVTKNNWYFNVKFNFFKMDNFFLIVQGSEIGIVSTSDTILDLFRKTGITLTHTTRVFIWTTYKRSYCSYNSHILKKTQNGIPWVSNIWRFMKHKLNSAGRFPENDHLLKLLLSMRKKFST